MSPKNVVDSFCQYDEDAEVLTNYAKPTFQKPRI
jgi:hypothetical protein